jgi:hypothetical protein
MSEQGFDWALVQMREGKKVRRKGWTHGQGAPYDEWITIRNNVIVDEDGKKTTFASQDPLTAIDWVLA